MEYFDFEGASSTHESNHPSDDVASIDRQFDDPEEREAEFDSLLEDQPLDFPNEPLVPETAEQDPKAVVPDQDTGVFPCSEPKSPATSAGKWGSIALLPNGESCTRTAGKFLNTLHTVSENAYIPTGSLTGKRALKSVSFSRKAINILKAWVRDHSESPYPNEDQKEELKQKTGLNKTQISNWLANARRRGKHSPPENEPATMNDITRALKNPPFDPSRQRPVQMSHVRPRLGDNDSSHASSDNKRYTASASSFDTSHSSLSDLSFASAFSHRSSSGSFGSMDRKERRRRRKVSAPVNTFNQQKARASRPFQCTFCTDSFASKYDWQRHEKSMHLILDMWTCSPHGGVTEESGTLRCVFCFIPNPDKDHLETHNYISCQEKSIQERTFYRKDHLNQHLRLMHDAKFQPCMEIWQSSITEMKSRCGFCGALLHTWKDRVDHLAVHFKNGANMSQWQGDWGFEPYILERVENAIPPYLIDYEWRSLNPWTTVQSQGDGTTSRLPVPSDANCYQRLTQELAVYIRNQTAQGIVPTDQMLQAEARRVIYAGDDDPWNQTCADNPVWLNILKRQNGLPSSAELDNMQFTDLALQPPYAGHTGLQSPPSGAQYVCTTRHARPQPQFRGSQPWHTESHVSSHGLFVCWPQPGRQPIWKLRCSLTGDASASSAPVPGAVDPLVQMGFDPEFLQRLNDSYSDLTPPEMEGLVIDQPETYGGKGKERWVDPPSQSQPVLGLPTPDAIPIFHSKETGPPVSDDTPPGMPAFRDNTSNF
ncbi:hypothetical protein N7468_007591 [Penicillium chermesinum]|uniref:Uncharacterized protein n=1 Tax=Penicillium chermesinum TaxID=63820 RepID=A0A9W9NUB4_9EURO|nr:uncharacterized protein N7468_007591 [Penicillium chermesinum]KAJ5226366.1 hypothetical protein N7468_007591 [Penicillium chermesinum]